MQYCINYCHLLCIMAIHWHKVVIYIVRHLQSRIPTYLVWPDTVAYYSIARLVCDAAAIIANTIKKTMTLSDTLDLRPLPPSTLEAILSFHHRNIMIPYIHRSTIPPVPHPLIGSFQFLMSDHQLCVGLVGWHLCALNHLHIAFIVVCIQSVVGVSLPTGQEALSAR